MNGLLGMLAMTASMLVVGWIVWKAITRREEDDGALQRQLDEDDRRAAAGRRTAAGMPPSDDRPRVPKSGQDR